MKIEKTKVTIKLITLCCVVALFWGTVCGGQALLNSDLAASAQEPAATQQPGDLNQDDTIDAVDALLTLQIAVDVFVIDSPLLYADVNQDQTINAEDALWLLRFAVFGSKNPADIFAFVGVEPPQQPPEEQPEIPSTPEQPPESEPALPPEEPVDPDHLHGDMVYDYPNFVSESAMVYWLKNGSGAYEDERTAMLQTATNQTITYYRPSPALLQYVSLDRIEVDGVVSMIYHYSFENGKNIMVATDKTSVVYEVKKQHYLDGVENHGCIVSEGIEYYYELASEATLVAWMQYGTAHLAIIYGHRDQSETLIPLLKLEQVTVKLNNDHVTQ